LKKIYPVFFTAVVFTFSAVMLIFSLLCSIKLSAVNDSLRRTEERAAALQTENEKLLARYESKISADKLEQYATEVLGMQHCSPGQIEYLEIDMG